MKKILIYVLICMLVSASIGMSVAGNVLPEQVSYPLINGNILYVGGSGPNNYTRIQDAVDNAIDGDTVFVYDDSAPYYETVSINKSIHLIGESKKTTVIDGRNRVVAVALTADEITLTGFTVQNATLSMSNGMYVRSNDNFIIDNIFSNNWFSDIYLDHSNNNTIRENTFKYSLIGMWLVDSNDTTITRNNITKNSDIGIFLIDSKRNNISENNIMDNDYHDALFYRLPHAPPLSNNWDANYWGRPYFLPKLIYGFLARGRWISHFPRLNFDWHPAKEPYDIPGMT
jgi:parallel beta-helix repeat protein